MLGISETSSSTFLVLLTMHAQSNKCVLHLIVRLLWLITQVTTPYQLKNMHLVFFSETTGSTGKLIATMCIWPPLSNMPRVRASEASRKSRAQSKAESACSDKRHSNKKRKRRGKGKKNHYTCQTKYFCVPYLPEGCQFSSCLQMYTHREQVLILEKWIFWVSLYFKQLVILTS